MCYCYYSKKVHLSSIKCAACLRLITSSIRLRAARTDRGVFAQSIAENTLDISGIHIQVDHNPCSVIAISSLYWFLGPSKGRSLESCQKSETSKYYSRCPVYAEFYAIFSFEVLLVKSAEHPTSPVLYLLFINNPW